MVLARKFAKFRGVKREFGDFFVCEVTGGGRWTFGPSPPPLSLYKQKSPNHLPAQEKTCIRNVASYS